MSDPDKTLIGATAQIAGTVYADLAQPSVRRIGQSVDGLLKIGLSPLSIVDWGFEKSRVWLQEKIADRMAQLPPDSVIPADDRIAIPVLLGIASSGSAPELRDLYAELLLKAMDRTTADQIHPAYVSTIGQLAPQEALAFFGLRERLDNNVFQDRASSRTVDEGPSVEEQFTEYCREIGLAHTEKARIWLENLRRLGLLGIERLSNVEYHEVDGGRGPRGVTKDDYRIVRFSEFGKRFLAACTPHGQVL